MSIVLLAGLALAAMLVIAAVVIVVVVVGRQGADE